MVLNNTLNMIIIDFSNSFFKLEEKLLYIYIQCIHTYIVYLCFCHKEMSKLVTNTISHNWNEAEYDY